MLYKKLNKKPYNK